MALTKRCLKGLIEYSDLRNVEGTFSEDDVMGVSTDKHMFPTKADLDGVNLLNYKLFPPGAFAFVADTSRRGDKIALAYNDTEITSIKYFTLENKVNSLEKELEKVSKK